MSSTKEERARLQSLIDCVPFLELFNLVKKSHRPVENLNDDPMVEFYNRPGSELIDVALKHVKWVTDGCNICGYVVECTGHDEEQ